MRGRNLGVGERPTVVLAAGGTGGHVFPAEALAGELLQRGYEVALVTDRRGRGFGDRLPGVALHRISAGAMAGSDFIDRARSFVQLGVGLFQARALLRQLRPALAVGFGGYPSVPTMLAASFARVPTLLHEQNAVLGRANRLLVRRATRIATSFPRLHGLAKTPPGKVVLTGNPVRPAIAALAGVPFPSSAVGPLQLLVLGGSQGARVFGSIVPAAFEYLPEPFRRRLHVAQQCRPEDLESASAAYAQLGVLADLAPFFQDVPQRMGVAHLVIARAGASTCAELAAAGRPALLVPYPFAADDHQTANARALAETGGAWVMPQSAFTAESLAQRLLQLFDDPGALAAAAARIGRFGPRDAAGRLADLAAALIAGNHGRARGSESLRPRAAE